MSDGKRRSAVMAWASGALCLLALGVAFFKVRWGDLDPARFLALVAVLAFFELFRVDFPWGRPMRLGIAVVLATLALRPAAEAVWVFALGTLLSRLLVRWRGQAGGELIHLAHRTLVVGISGMFFFWVSRLGWELSWNPYPPHYVLEPTTEGVYYTFYNPVVLHRALAFPLAFAAVAALFYLGETLTGSLEMAVRTRGDWRAWVRQQVRQTLPTYLATAAAAALMTLYFPRLPWANFFIFALPLLLVRMVSHRYRELDERFFQTVRVLGEAFDRTRGKEGHSSRVSNLASEVAREMGLSLEEIRMVRYAAALHDIGYVETGGEGEGHAERGAGVIERLPGLESAAELVRHHHGSGGEGARIPLGSRIIRAVSDFDMATASGGERVAWKEVLREMDLERGRAYDSRVLRFLRQVVEAQSRARKAPEREVRQRAKVLEEEELASSLERLFRGEEGRDE